MPYIEVTNEEDMNRGLVDFNFAEAKEPPLLQICTNSDEVAAKFSKMLRHAAVFNLQDVSTNLFYHVDYSAKDKIVRVTGNIFNAIEQMLKYNLISNALHKALNNDEKISLFLNDSKTFDDDLDYPLDDETIDRLISSSNQLNASKAVVNNQQNSEEEMMLHKIESMDPNTKKDFLTKLANTLKPYGYEITIKDTINSNNHPSSKVY